MVLKGEREVLRVLQERRRCLEELEGVFSGSVLKGGRRCCCGACGVERLEMGP